MPGLLLFHTLPLVFAGMTGGAGLAILFFLLVFVAAITSQISAMEPTIAFLVDRFRFSRRNAVTLCTVGVFLLGCPARSRRVSSPRSLFCTKPPRVYALCRVQYFGPPGGFWPSYWWGGVGVSNQLYKRLIMAPRTGCKRASHLNFSLPSA